VGPVDLDLPGTTAVIAVPGDVQIYGGTARLRLEGDDSLELGNLVGYLGALDLVGATTSDAGRLIVRNDLVIFGSSYDPDDPETGTPLAFAYDHPARFAGNEAAWGLPSGVAPDGAVATPAAPIRVGETIPVVGTVIDGSAFGAGTGAGLAVSDLSGAYVQVDGNFYVNGADLVGTSGWQLAVRDADRWSTAFSEAYNLRVENSAVVAHPNDGGPGRIAAAEHGQSDGYVGVGNSLVASDGSGSGWDFVAPSIVADDGSLGGTYTVSDNVVRVEFSETIENSNNEVASALANGVVTLEVDGVARPYTRVWADETGSSTEGAGDLSVLYFVVDPSSDPSVRRWKTDATGASAGSAQSTDRSGSDPGDVIPSVGVVKLSGSAFAGLVDASKNRLSPAAGRFTGVTDRAGPTLHTVEVDRADHNGSTSSWWDGHNLIRMRYSEPVKFGADPNAAGEADALDVGTGEAAADPASRPFGWEPPRSESSFAAPGEVGGAVDSDGTTASLVGYLLFGNTAAPAPFAAGARDQGSAFDDGTANGLRRVDEWTVEVYISGFARWDGSSWQWPGYHWKATQPSPVAPYDPSSGYFTVPENQYLSDRSSSPSGEVAVDHTMAPTHFAEVSAWDVDPPAFTFYFPDGETTPYREIVPLDTTGGDALIDRLDFHVLDNSSDNTPVGWSSAGPGTDHPDFRPNQGVRDGSLQDVEAFVFERNEVEPLKPLPGGGFSTDIVDNILFQPTFPHEIVGATAADDSYFSLEFDGAAAGYEQRSQLWMSYDETKGLVTDLAGNLLRSVSKVQAIERMPPEIELTLAAVDATKMYLQFSEPVSGSGTGGSIVPADLTLSGTNAIADVVPVDTVGSATRSVFLTLLNPVDADYSVQGMIAPAGPKVLRDRAANYMSDTESNRISDVGLGIAEPVWASTELQQDEVLGSGFKAVRSFDGSEIVLDRDITLQIRLALSGSLLSVPVRLYYDVEAVDTGSVGTVWLPAVVNGLIEQPNNEAREAPRVGNGTVTRDFIIPADDPELEPGVDLEFVLEVGPVFAARLTDPEDPRTIAPWMLAVGDIIRQRAGVTILNNVIYPQRGDKTVVTYETGRNGIATVQIFTLDGSLVKVLHRGRQTAGVHNFAWDGRNTNGDIVARGIYFVRIVAPDIDEYRKVIVAKE
jgi:hypothetical protein